MTIGIYFLEINDRFYIGQSVNVEDRIYEHKRTLHKNEHFNYKVQEAFNKFPETFSHGIIEVCLSSKLDELEILYMKEFNSIEEGYNIVPGGNTGNRRGETHPCAKYTKEQILKTVELLAEGILTQVDISNITGISSPMVNNIANGRNHTWISEEYEDLYTKMRSIDREKIGDAAKHGVFKIKPFYVENKSLGIIERIDVIANFARKYNMVSSKGNLSMLKNETRKVQSVKGWTLYKPLVEGLSI